MQAENDTISKFIALQKELLLIERNEEEEQLKELLSNTSIHELSDYGLSIKNLKIKSSKMGMFDKPEITLVKKWFNKNKKNADDATDKEFKDKIKVRRENTRISQGDIVGLYKYRKDIQFLDDHPVLTGSVSRMSDFKITLMCDGRSDVDVFTETFEGGAYSLVQMVNDVTFKRFNKGLDRLEFYTNRSEFKVNELIKVIFDLQNTEDFVPDPRIHPTWQDNSLNQYQKQAVNMALACKHYSLIHGPPGTGKTKTVCEIIRQMCSKGKKLLVTASSNIAVDNIVERIAEFSKTLPTEQQLRMVRVGNPSRTMGSTHEFSLDYLVSIEVKKSPEFKQAKKDRAKLIQELKKLSKKKYTKDIKERKKDIHKMVREVEREMNGIKKDLIFATFESAQVVFSTQTSSLDRNLEKWLSNEAALGNRAKQQNSSLKGNPHPILYLPNLFRHENEIQEVL